MTTAGKARASYRQMFRVLTGLETNAGKQSARALHIWDLRFRNAAAVRRTDHDEI
jgi:hypothetical protein